MPAMFGPDPFRARLRRAGQELDDHVLAAAEMRAPAELDRARRGDGLLGELNIAASRSAGRLRDRAPSNRCGW